MRWMLIAIMTMIAGMSLAAQSSDPWEKLNFLVGDWIGMAGEKDTPLGSGQGAFSFQLELNKKILVRRNNASYNSGAEHDDLLVIYRDEAGKMPRAIYFDSEGHVIRYVTSFPSANRVVFESERGQAGPAYRLSYWMEGAELKGRFEVAAEKGEYKTYLSWRSRRR